MKTKTIMIKRYFNQVKSALFLVLCFIITSALCAQSFTKPRVIVTTDLGADPDDIQSMVRFLVQSNEFDVEGLITSTGCWRKSQSNTNMMSDILNAYDSAYNNLSAHSPDFPTPSYLRSINVLGQNGYGMGDVGSGQDSAGSELIIAAVDKNDPRPVWVQFWGGANTLAQAIWKVQNTRSSAELQAFISKIRVYDILGQGNAGTWMAKTFPDLIYIRATNVYAWQPSDGWIDTNVQNGHGALGNIYPDRRYATEGDTPAFLHVLPNGLNNPSEPWQGGWGGRFGRNKQSGIRGMSCMSGEDAPYDTYFMYGNQGGPQDWQPAINNDFQARMDWARTSSYSSVNHHPIAVLNNDQTRDVLEIYASPGSTVDLSAAGSTDPDGNALNYSWSYYQAASTYSGSVSVGGNGANASVQIPSNANNTEIHVILTITDNGSPSLYAYRRALIRVTNEPPTSPIVEITSPSNGAVFFEGDMVSIEATATPREGTVTQVEFFVDGTSVGVDNTAPYTATYTATGGSHTIRAVATDTQNDEGSDQLSITVNIPQGPYNGNPHAIPGTIQFEDFDVGGNGSAYYDDTPGSETGNSFRNDEDVDIEDCTDTGGGYNIGWFTGGEWLEYTVNVASAGTYDIDLRVACDGDSRTVSMTMDGANIANNIAIPNTGGWQAWQTITVNDVQLNAGEQILRLTMGATDYVNLNYVTFNAVNVSATTVAITSPSNNSAFEEGENIVINATATADSGSITNVMFYIDDQLVSTDTEAPYTYETATLSEGSHTIRAEANNSNGETATSQISVTVTGDNPGPITSGFWFEAECGNVGGLFNEVTDSNASGDAYVTVQSGNNSTANAPGSNGQISFTFNVEEGGDYNVWARVITPNATDDSFWVQMDGGTWVLWNSIGPHNNWAWEQATSYNLSVGAHTLVIGYREDGALLDKLHLTNLNETPSGEGDMATNCDGTVPETYNLTTSVNPANGGSVSLSPSGGSYEEGTVVTVTATPSSGFEFDNWSGASSSSSSSIQITMDANKTLTANFSEETTGNEQTITLQENVEGFCGVNGSIDSNNSGYTGAGFANTDNANNTGVDWSIIGDAGSYTFTWRFANGTTANRSGVLYINNTQVSTIDFNGTGGWSTWDTNSVTITNVAEGYKTIRLEANQDAGLGNIDYLEVTAINVSVGNCDGPGTNVPPVANAGSDQTVTDSDDNGSESVTLNGSGSTDSDGSIVSYVWTENGTEIATGSTPSVNLSTGTHTLVLTVTDNEGVTASDEVNITVNAASGTDNISVRALGIVGDETLELEIDGTVVATWTMSTSYQIFTYSGPSVGVFRLNFTNDAGSRDIQVDYLEVSGTTYQAEDQDINTALYANGACGGGGNSEIMNCNGYIQFNVGGVCADTDGDGTDDCSDNCPNDPNKVNPGDCGCGVPEGSCDGLQFAIPGGNQGIAACKAKFVGNIMPSSWQGQVIRSDFSTYWNQVTAENAGKWGVVEGSRDNYSWGDLDQMYNYAQQNNIPFKHHVFIWGSQQPNWLSGLSASDQRAEVEEWYSLFAQRYPNTAIIDVVNESLPGHAPDVAVRDALGGFNNGANNPYLSSHPEYGPYGTGWDYIIYAFAKAREYFPNAILILNDYGIINNPSAINTHLNIVNILKQRGLIDGVGIQAHAFSVDNMSGSQVTNNLNLLDDAGLPIHVTELDIRGSGGSESSQRDRYAQIFPAFYEHPAVAGITLWGYVETQTWMDNSGILNSNGTERAAMQWLKQYMASQPDVCNQTFSKTIDNRKAVHVYPNPMTDVLTITLNTLPKGVVNVSILSLDGREVKSTKLNSASESIDVTDLPNGLYMLRVSTDTMNYMTKIVK